MPKRATKYPIEVRWSSEDESYLAEVYDLPGCMADGATEKEAVENALESIRLWIQTAKAEKRPIPAPSKREEASGKFVVRIPRSLHRRLHHMAQRENVSLNQLVLSLLAEREAERR